MAYRPKTHTASLFINGSRAYLVGAHKLCGRTYIELSYNKDFAHKFSNLHNARAAREALATGRFSDAIIWRSNIV
jgi:hypothetical protein